ncbi:MAG: hypothetical protein KDC12_14485 [Flavobacteriales bacterium]|nr:hypothetical protein [Flavobacteriales bacterium]
MIKPIHTLISLLSLGALCALLMWIFPKDGISLTSDIQLKFESFDEFLTVDTLYDKPIANIEEFLNVYEAEIDSTAILDSLRNEEIRVRKELMRLQFPDTERSDLNAFFQQLYALEKDKSRSLRILHYGDSQIEGDRISGYVRNEMQKRFGGSGPGLVHITEVVPTLAIDQSASDNWFRYTINGKKDTTVQHNRYGMLAHFNRAAPYLAEWPHDTVIHSWLEFQPGRMTYSRSKKWNRMKLYSGYCEHPYLLKVIAGDSVVFADSVRSNQSYDYREFKFVSTPEKVRLEFTGNPGPELYGVSFDSPSGIHLDNIPLRGSSGTLFKKISKAQLQQQYNTMDVGLVILQFGGNVLPYIENVEEAERYGGWFKAQILYLQSLLPDASFLIIGPSDMAIKDKDHFITRPYLEDVRNALRATAMETGCAFWDIYEVMGGRNSMQSWVEADPPLAGSDYTHFTPAGAKRIAELLYKAISQDYEAWKAAQ